MTSHEEYQNLLYQLFMFHAKEYYDVALPRQKEVKDYSDLLQNNVSTFYEAIKFMKQNINLHEIYSLPWTFTLNDTKFEKKVTVSVDFARKQVSYDEDDVFDKSKIVVDIQIEPYPAEEITTIFCNNYKSC